MQKEPERQKRGETRREEGGAAAAEGFERNLPGKDWERWEKENGHCLAVDRGDVELSISPSSQVGDATSVRIVSQNMHLRDRRVCRIKGGNAVCNPRKSTCFEDMHDARASAAAKAFAQFDAEVFCFQEVADPSAQRIFLEGIRRESGSRLLNVCEEQFAWLLKRNADCLPGGTMTSSGGLFTLFDSNRLELLDAEVRPFPQNSKCGADYGWVNKGMLWALFRDKRTEARFSVTNTHPCPFVVMADSWGVRSAATPEKIKEAHRRQFDVMRQFLLDLKEQSRQPADVPAFWAGDMNTNVWLEDPVNVVRDLGFLESLSDKDRHAIAGVARKHVEAMASTCCDPHFYEMMRMAAIRVPPLVAAPRSMSRYLPRVPYYTWDATENPITRDAFWDPSWEWIDYVAPSSDFPFPKVSQMYAVRVTDPSGGFVVDQGVLSRQCDGRRSAEQEAYRKSLGEGDIVWKDISDHFAVVGDFFWVPSSDSEENGRGGGASSRKKILKNWAKVLKRRDILRGSAAARDRDDATRIWQWRRRRTPLRRSSPFFRKRGSRSGALSPHSKNEQVQASAGIATNE